ncbi:MAG: prolipoprotein diacylglyceryl transferase [Spirochaetota bacterium]
MLGYVQYPSWIQPEVIPGLPVRWYGLMYLFAFATAFLLVLYQVKERKRSSISIEGDPLVGMSTDDVITLFLWLIIGLLVGARIFAAIIYEPSGYYLSHPWMIFWPFRNGQFVGLQGMSYHGGVVGAVLAGLFYARRYRKQFFQLADAVIAGVPLGYTFGRLGNFLNAELFGRVTDKPWGMVFPTAEPFSTRLAWVREIAEQIGMSYQEGTLINLPRHPSQLYEAFFEGIVLFCVIWFIFRKRKTFHGQLLSVYLIGYSLVRFAIEYYRKPDEEIGFVLALGAESTPPDLLLSYLNFSMGQVLSLFMIIAGVVMYLLLKRSFPVRIVTRNKRKKKR